MGTSASAGRAAAPGPAKKPARTLVQSGVLAERDVEIALSPGFRWGGTLLPGDDNTLRIVAEQPDFGRLMFDIGLPSDRLATELRLRLKMDIEEGIANGLFTVADVDLATSIVAGAITGLALDLHRGVLGFDKIDPATAQLME
eukprot:gene14525-19218_t